MRTRTRTARPIRSALALATALALVTLLPALPATAGADAFVDASDRGWWNSKGRSFTNENYCVGQNCGSDASDKQNEFRNFFVFELPSGGGEAVIDAWVTVTNVNGAGTPRVYALHGVTSSAAAVGAETLVNSEAGRVVFKDLGDGPLLGQMTSASPVQTPVVVPFGALGRVEVTKALGETFIVGGMLVNDTPADNMFGGTSEGSVPLSGVQIAYDLGPATENEVSAPNKVKKGARVTIRGVLGSGYDQCETTQEVALKVGASTTDVMTDEDGAYSLKKRITKKTVVTALFAGGSGASDMGCGASLGKTTIRLK